MTNPESGQAGPGDINSAFTEKVHLNPRVDSLNDRFNGREILLPHSGH
jgi:hypothetical protein